jgi:hypothetical protein
MVPALSREQPSVEKSHSFVRRPARLSAALRCGGVRSIELRRPSDLRQKPGETFIRLLLGHAGIV